jgi:hypothetical protein
MITVTNEKRDDRLGREVPRRDLIAGFIHAAMWCLYPRFSTGETECSTLPGVSCMCAAERNLGQRARHNANGKFAWLQGHQKSCHEVLPLPQHGYL